MFGHGLRNKDLYPKLVKLKMQDIELGLHEESAMFDSLLTLLANNRKLQWLFLGGNSLSPAKMYQVLTSLEDAAYLVDLELGYQLLDDSWVLQLWNYLGRLRYLDLNNCRLGDDRVNLLIAPLCHSTMLKTLDLSGNNLTDKFMKEFWDILQSLGDEESKSVYNSKNKHLYQTPSLGPQDSEENTINENSEDNNRSGKESLTNLSLANNKITDSGAKLFARLLRSSPYFLRTLKRVNLCDNKITDFGREKLKGAIGERPGLTILTN